VWAAAPAQSPSSLSRILRLQCTRLTRAWQRWGHEGVCCAVAAMRLSLQVQLRHTHGTFGEEACSSASTSFMWSRTGLAMVLEPGHGT
jgi:hypothetical protein